MNENEKKDLHPTQRSQQISSITERYGTKAQFLQLFLFDFVAKYTADAKRCIVGNAPTFHAINAAYGKDTAEGWLTIAWTRLNEYAGNQGKVTEYQLRELAITTVMGYGHLKISEFMLFSRYFKEGKYNHIWGRNVDPLQLMEALRSFIAERNDMLSHYIQEEREERERKEREEQPPMSYLDYCAKHGITPNPKILTQINNNNG